MSGETTKKINELSEALEQVEKQDESSFGTKVLAVIAVGCLFFPFGLAFIALCRWLWPMAFPQ